MTPPFISVIIDTYNYGHFIEKAIDSVLSQDFPPDRMEVLVIDDGSTDDTAAHVKKYGSQIQYFQKANRGQASAFNWGFTRARGDIICFLDADDYWAPNKLERIVDVFQCEPVGMVYHNYALSRPDPRIPCNLAMVSGNIPDDFASLMRYRIFPTSCLAFRREALSRLLPIPESIRLQADAYLALLIIFVAPVYAIPQDLTIYRLHGQNSYNVDAVRNTPDVQRRRNEISKIILVEIRLWLARNGIDLNQRSIRAFVDQWTIFQQNAEYSIDPPTRLEFFSHLLRYNRTYRSQQNWKLTVLNYFSAIAALATGYKQPPAQMTLPEEVRHG